MAADPEMIHLLKSIDRRLALLSLREEQDVRQRFEGEVLRSPARIAMFRAINGNTSSAALATAASVTDRAAQLFVKELLEQGFVKSVQAPGRTVMVEVDHDRVLAWYFASSS